MKLKQLLASPPIFNGMLIPCSVIRIALLRAIFYSPEFLYPTLYNNADGYNEKIVLIFMTLLNTLASLHWDLHNIK
jgi:hypothetical protein